MPTVRTYMRGLVVAVATVAALAISYALIVGALWFFSVALSR
jgi:hypothetical protein